MLESATIRRILIAIITITFFFINIRNKYGQLHPSDREAIARARRRRQPRRGQLQFKKKRRKNLASNFPDSGFELFTGFKRLTSKSYQGAQNGRGRFLNFDPVFELWPVLSDKLEIVQWQCVDGERVQTEIFENLI